MKREIIFLEGTLPCRRRLWRKEKKKKTLLLQQEVERKAAYNLYFGKVNGRGYFSFQFSCYNPLKKGVYLASLYISKFPKSVSITPFQAPHPWRAELTRQSS